MKKLANMLGESLGRDEILRAARAQRVLKRWPEVVGEEMAKRSWPERYDHGTVWIAVQGSAWAQELRMLKNTILGKLCALSQEPDLFHEVRFGVRPLNPPEQEELFDYEGAKQYRESLKGLSIEEIRKQREDKWKE